MTLPIVRLTVLLVGSLIAPLAISAVGPTREGALATVQEMAKAMRENDADGIARLLADDWAVISARGQVFPMASSPAT
jgi:hypothetical protein